MRCFIAGTAQKILDFIWIFLPLPENLSCCLFFCFSIKCLKWGCCILLAWNANLSLFVASSLAHALLASSDAFWKCPINQRILKFCNQQRTMCFFGTEVIKSAKADLRRFHVTFISVWSHRHARTASSFVHCLPAAALFPLICFPSSLFHLVCAVVFQCS